MSSAMKIFTQIKKEGTQKESAHITFQNSAQLPTTALQYPPKVR
jgi:hypothetical protein